MCGGRSSCGKCSSATRQKLVKSAAVYVLFIGLGFGYAMVGPTLVSMETLLETDLETLSWSVTGTAIGSLIGATMCTLTFDQFNKELQLSLAAFLEGGACAAAPFTGNVYAYIAVITLFFCGHGFVNSAGNAYAANLWRGQHRERPFMQGLHAIWCVGSTSGPVIIRQFLVPLDGASNVTEVMTGNTSTPLSGDVGLVRYAYVTIGGLIICCGLVSLASFFYTCSKQEKPETGNVPPKARRKLKRFDICFIVMLLPLFFIISTLEGSFITFISPFAVKHLDWDVPNSAVLVSVILAAFGVSRLVSIPISTLLTPCVMLIINMSGMVVSLIIMCFAEEDDIIIWLSVAMAGLFLATAFPTTILWASTYIQISGLATGIFVVGMQISSFVFPPLFGYILTHHNAMLMVYIQLSLAGLHVLFFVIIYLYARRHHHRHMNTAPKAEQLQTNASSCKDGDNADISEISTLTT